MSSFCECDFDDSRCYLNEKLPGAVLRASISLQEQTILMTVFCLACPMAMPGHCLWTVYSLLRAEHRADASFGNVFPCTSLKNLRNCFQHIAGSALRHGEAACKILQDLWEFVRLCVISLPRWHFGRSLLDLDLSCACMRRVKIALGSCSWTKCSCVLTRKYSLVLSCCRWTEPNA